jgi:hypothetical protein
MAIKLLAPEVATGRTPEAQVRRERSIHEAQAAWYEAARRPGGSTAASTP